VPEPSTTLPKEPIGSGVIFVKVNPAKLELGFF
jgi:hypothetical protein